MWCRQIKSVTITRGLVPWWRSPPHAGLPFTLYLLYRHHGRRTDQCQCRVCHCPLQSLTGQEWRSMRKKICALVDAQVRAQSSVRLLLVYPAEMPWTHDMMPTTLLLSALRVLEIVRHEDEWYSRNNRGALVFQTGGCQNGCSFLHGFTTDTDRLPVKSTSPTTENWLQKVCTYSMNNNMSDEDKHDTNYINNKYTNA